MLFGVKDELFKTNLVRDNLTINTTKEEKVL